MHDIIKPLVKFLNVKTSQDKEPSMNERISGRFIDHIMAGMEGILGEFGHLHLRDRYKYFDDLTVVEIVNLLNIGISTARVRDTVPSDLPQHNQLIDNNNLSQKYLDSINQWTDKNLMELNAKKTKSIQFNFSKNLQFKTDLFLKQQKIENVTEIKLLGIILTSDLR